MVYLLLYLYLVGVVIVYGLNIELLKYKEPPIFENNHTYLRKRRIPAFFVSLLWPALPVLFVFVRYY